MIAEIAILSLIPQRPPFVMVDRLLSSDEQSTKTAFMVKEDNVLVNDGYFSEAGLMENIAQTAAARAGYAAIKGEKPIQSGYIAAVKNFEVYMLPKVNDTLLTEVKIVEQVFDTTMIAGTISLDGRLIAQCEMSIFNHK